MSMISSLISLFGQSRDSDIIKMIDLFKAVKSANQDEYKALVKELQALYIQIHRQIDKRYKSRYDDAIGNLVTIMDNYDDAKKLTARIDKAIAILESIGG